MTAAYICLVITLFLPYVFTGYAKLSGPGYRNDDARDFMASLEGKRKRAYWAHKNQFESFAPFAIGILLAHMRQAPQHLIDAFAITYLCFRAAYFLFYVANKSTLRSLMWLGGLVCTVSLYFIGF